MKEVIIPKDCPKPIGPYSPGIKCNGFIFAGALGIDPKTEKLKDGIKEQTFQALKNIRTILESAGSSMEKVVKTTVYLKSMDDFDEMNKVYKKFFDKNYPMRATVEV